MMTGNGFLILSFTKEETEVKEKTNLGFYVEIDFDLSQVSLN